MDNNQFILDEYQKQRPLFRSFAQMLADLLKQILKANDITVNAIPCREKDPDSLLKKVSKEGNEQKYTKLSDITDLAGVRIITYFSDDVDKIAAIIEDEFVVDSEKSIDKRKTLDPDRFGYISLHYIIKLKPNRAMLPEYSAFTDLYAEIQVRSILQHAWAEIEHDLGYKSRREIPRDIRRSFSRLAGLLELTDIEFLRIRDELLDYQTNVQSQITISPASVHIDRLSLQAYVENSPIVSEIAEQMCKLRPNVELSYEDNEWFIENLHFVGIETISQLNNALMDNKEAIIKFTDCLLEKTASGFKFDKSIPLFYLCYVLVTNEGSFDQISKYVSEFINQERAEEVSKQIIEISSKIKKQK